MSTDFSIRPVGAPVAPSFPPAPSSAALGGVPTQLPASQSVTATDASTASTQQFSNEPEPGRCFAAGIF